jgi:hypothetical protein
MQTFNDDHFGQCSMNTDERIDDITESHLVLHWFMGVAALQDFFRRAYPSNLQTEIFQIGQCVDCRFQICFVYSTFSLNDIL